MKKELNFIGLKNYLLDDVKIKKEVIQYYLKRIKNVIDYYKKKFGDEISDIEKDKFLDYISNSKNIQSLFYFNILDNFKIY